MRDSQPDRGYVVPDAPAASSASSTTPGGPSATAPAVNPPRWSGKKTAIAAALAIGFSSAGALAAAAVVPAGAGADIGPGGMRGPGRTAPQFPGSNAQLGQPGQDGQLGQSGQPSVSPR